MAPLAPLHTRHHHTSDTTAHPAPPHPGITAPRRHGPLQPVFLDSTDADDIDTILSDGVARSDCLLLLQTGAVLTRPWVLLEIFEAVRLHIPIVTLHIAGSGRVPPCSIAHLSPWLYPKP